MNCPRGCWFYRHRLVISERILHTFGKNMSSYAFRYCIFSIRGSCDSPYAILQTTFSNSFSCVKIVLLWLEFQWNSGQWTRIQNLSEYGLAQATRRYLNQWRPSSLTHSVTWPPWVNILMLEQNSCRFAHKRIQCILWKIFVSILIQILPMFGSKGSTDNKSAWAQMMIRGPFY